MDEAEDIKRLSKLVEYILHCLEACEDCYLPTASIPFILCPRGATGDDVQLIMTTVLAQGFADIKRDASGHHYLRINDAGRLMLLEPEGETC